MFSLICASLNGWVNNGEAGDLRRHRAHYGFTVMRWQRAISLYSRNSGFGQYTEKTLLNRVLYYYVHYSGGIMGAMTSQITGVTIDSTVCSGTGQRKHQKHRITGLCEGNSPVTGEIAAQRASNAANVSIWWRHLMNLMMFYLLAYEWAIPVAI